MTVRIRRLGGLGGDEWTLHPRGLRTDWKDQLPDRSYHLGDPIMMLEGLERLGAGITSSGSGGTTMVVPGAPTAEGGPPPRCPTSTVCYKQGEGGAWSRVACGTAGAVPSNEARGETRYGPGVCQCSGDLLAIDGRECVTREEYQRRSVRETPAPPVPAGYAGPWVEIGIFKFHPDGGFVRDHRAAFLETARSWLREELDKQKPKVVPAIFQPLVQRQIDEWKRDWRLIPELRRIFPDKINDPDFYPSKALVTGKVPIAKVDHPTKGGEDWGLYFAADMDGSTLEFKKVPDRRSWLGRFWDGLKKFVGKLVGALKDALEWLADKACALAKGPLLDLAAQGGASAVGAPAQLGTAVTGLSRVLCGDTCGAATSLVKAVTAQVKAGAKLPESLKNDLFLAGLSFEEVQKLDATAGVVEVAAVQVVANKAIAKFCGKAPEKTPEEEKGFNVGVTVALGIGAATGLFLLLRRG